MKVKVKISADHNTAAALRALVTKVANAGVATTETDVQMMAWLLEMAREIHVAEALARADRLSLDFDRGFEMVLSR